ncbi:MAG: nucleoside-diphosphate kinase [Ruminiclostridium sp.]|nr:nucleoside-diphosphate kinase [Ruminiclostridium sp.]
MERTLVILKPDTLKRKLMGEIISRFERKNFTIVEMKMMTIQLQTAEEHYKHIKSLSIYDDMIRYFISSPVIVMILKGNNIIQGVRNLVGKTSWLDSAPGTIRGDFGSHTYQNLIHASDSVENAEIEIKRFFGGT